MKGEQLDHGRLMVSVEEGDGGWCESDGRGLTWRRRESSGLTRCSNEEQIINRKTLGKRHRPFRRRRDKLKFDPPFTLSHCCVNMVEKPIIMIKMEMKVGKGKGEDGDLDWSVRQQQLIRCKWCFSRAWMKSYLSLAHNVTP